MKIKNKHGNPYMADTAASSQQKTGYRSEYLRDILLNMKITFFKK